MYLLRIFQSLQQYWWENPYFWGLVFFFGVISHHLCNRRPYQSRAYPEEFYPFGVDLKVHMYSHLLVNICQPLRVDSYT